MNKKTIEVIVGRKPDMADLKKENARRKAIHGSVSRPSRGEVQGRGGSKQRLVVCPFDGSYFYAEVPDDGQWHLVVCPNGGQEFYV
jgi:hypothetical protein